MAKVKQKKTNYLNKTKLNTYYRLRQRNKRERKRQSVKQTQVVRETKRDRDGERDMERQSVKQTQVVRETSRDRDVEKYKKIGRETGQRDKERKRKKGKS